LQYKKTVKKLLTKSGLECKIEKNEILCTMLMVLKAMDKLEKLKNEKNDHRQRAIHAKNNVPKTHF
jgi:hypothetical protein